MPHVIRISRRGNAHGISIPRLYLHQLRWMPGQYVSMQIEDGKLVVTNTRASMISLAATTGTGARKDGRRT